MHRIDADGHAGNLFTDGNPATGTPATVVDAAILNAFQEEICAVIGAAGIALEKGTNNQLLSALDTLMSGPGKLLPDPYLVDAQENAENDATRGAIKFKAGADAWCWNHYELWRSGVDYKVVLEAMATTAMAATVYWNVAYLVVADGAANPVAKTRWAASTAKALGDLVIPKGINLNGYYYECTTAGTTGASQPTWGTTPGGTTSDGTVVWTCRAGGFKNLSLTITPPNAAYQRFDIDNATLTIPQTEPGLGAGARLHLGFWRRGSADGHTGGLLMASARLVPVEV